jgi:hypothetical protein
MNLQHQTGDSVSHSLVSYLHRFSTLLGKTRIGLSLIYP